jgi:ABC-type Fe3+ transport system permease subunit
MGLKRASGRIRRRIDPALMLPLAAAAVLVYLAAVPVGMLILSSFQKGLVEVELTLDNYVTAYANPDTYSTLVNSLVFGVSSAVATFVVATVLAWLVERTDTPFRRVFMVVAVAPLILPGVLEAIAWVFLLAPRSGYINVAARDLFGLSADPFNIFTLPGMIWVQSIGQVPLAMLLMIAAFRSMDPSLEESAAMSGANTFQILRRITMRLIVPVSASVLLLLFVRTIEGFEVAAIMGLPGKVYVYTSEIYQAYRRFPPNYGLASALGVGLTLLTCVGLFLYIRATRYGERFQTVTGKAFRPKRFELGRWRWVSAAFLVGYLAIAVIMPFLVVAWQSLMPYYVSPSLEALSLASVDAYAALPENKRFLTALFNSLTLSILAATITVLLTSVVAWVVYQASRPSLPRLPGLPPDHRAGDRARHGLDRVLRLVSDRHLRNPVADADRVHHQVPAVRNALGIRVDRADPSRPRRGGEHVGGVLVAGLPARHVAAPATRPRGWLDLHRDRGVPGVRHVGDARDAADAGPLDPDLQHVRPGRDGRSGGHRHRDGRDHPDGRVALQPGDRTLRHTGVRTE